ncbi:MAG: hypothetical protein C3F17_00245 [Bradyrhizobiaceae bacterium]|nr:MAG: hypothetical protein C3F17_00245 [Bradyrhizobiaceae bacterium]
MSRASGPRRSSRRPDARRWPRPGSCRHPRIRRPRGCGTGCGRPDRGRPARCRRASRGHPRCRTRSASPSSIP